MMRRMVQLTPFILMLTLILIISPATIMTQGSCSSLVSIALEEVGDACGTMDRNSACYGYRLVNATFMEEQDEEFFTTASDRSEIGLIRTIATAAMDVENDHWGVAVLNLQANIPNTLPGQAVTFVLLGDVEVENAVEPEEAFVPADPIPITTVQDSNMRSGPGLTYNVLGTVLPGTGLQADGFNEDGDWLRVVYDEVPAWIYAALAQSVQDLSGLPTLSADQRLPMQAFYLRTGVGEAICEEAPEDVLMVQGPENITVDLTVNGATVSISSTVLFKVIPPGDLMEITVIDGDAIVDGVLVKEGYKTTVCLSEPDNRGVDGQANDRVVSCAPSEPVPLDDDDVSGWCTLGDIPANLLNYPVPIGCEEGFIRPAETQEPVPVVVVPQTPRFDCSTLVIGGPTEGMQAVNNTFWWYGVEAATDYKVLVYDAAGAVIKEASTVAPTTWIDIDGINPNQTISWAVEAYRDGTPICQTTVPDPVVVVPAPPPPVTAMTGSWACGPSVWEATVTWANADPGDTISIELRDNQFGITPAYFGGGSGASGSVIIPVDMYILDYGVITAVPSGKTFTLPGTIGGC